MDELPAALTRLNIETRAFHGAAESGWRTLMTREVTREQYLDQLVRVYGFEGPLEAALAYTPKLELVIDVHERFRAGFIAQDLLALGLKPAQIARLPQCVLAPFSTPLEALGWMYVSERATPLHDEVRRCVSLRLPQAKDARAYLSASDGMVSARWLELGRKLDRAARTPRMLDDVIAGAHAGFRTWIEWSRPDRVQQRIA